jgi:hypothetical protein
MNVSWNAPSSSGSSSITTYRLCRGTFSGSSSICWNLPSWQFSYTDSGLTILTQRYYYRVAAINGAGRGPWSNESCMRPFPWYAGLGCQ